MARSFTLATLRTEVRRRADVENDNHITDSEINSYISASYTWLHDLLVNSGLFFFHSTQTITTTGVATYNLSSDFLSVIRVRYKVDNQNTWARVMEISPHEIDRASITGVRAAWYMIVGNQIEFFPTPPSGQTYEVRYIPCAATLSADGDTIDGVNGWEELIIVDAALKCLQKQKRQEEMTTLRGDKKDLIGRITAMSQNRQIASATSLFVENDDGIEPDAASWRILRA